MSSWAQIGWPLAVEQPPPPLTVGSVHFALQAPLVALGVPPAFSAASATQPTSHAWSTVNLAPDFSDTQYWSFVVFMSAGVHSEQAGHSVGHTLVPTSCGQLYAFSAHIAAQSFG